MQTYISVQGPDNCGACEFAFANFKGFSWDVQDAVSIGYTLPGRAVEQGFEFLLPGQRDERYPEATGTVLNPTQKTGTTRCC